VRVNFGSDKTLRLKREMDEQFIAAAKVDSEKHLEDVRKSIENGITPKFSADGCYVRPKI
jgi:hypothetical protein